MKNTFMAINQKSTPTLRFKDQQGNDYPDWKKKPIGKIGEIIGGGTPATNQNRFWNGNINWFTPSEIKSKYSNSSIRKISEQGLAQSSAKLLPAGTILLTSRATIGEVSIAREECTTNQGFQSCVVNSSSYSNEYTYYWIVKNKILFLRIANGSTYLEVTNSEIKKILFDAPNLKEQHKIALFLASVDTKIQQLGKKKALVEQYKKGMMQKLFSQDVRFKDEQGNDYSDWEERRLGDVLDYEQPTEYLVENSVYDDGYKTPVLTAGKTFLLGYTNEKTGIFIDKLPTIIFDDFTTAFKYVDFPFKAKSSAMKMLIPKSKWVNMKFVYKAMKRVRFPLGEHKRYWISEYQREKISYPSLEEQQKIADFLSAIDKKIELVAEQLGQAHTFKNGLLQKMFI